MVKRTDLSPVIVNDIALRPQNELHRRKLEALRYFMQQLLDSPIRDGIAKVILFGSALEGDVGVESDVDLLVISAKDTASVREACADASLETGFATKESVQPLVYTLAHYLHPRSYFLYQVSRQGREVYTVKEADLKRTAIETLYTLASDYLEGAKETLASGRLRLAVDAGYNAAELSTKAFLYWKLESLPKTHGGLINAFSHHYVKSGPFPRQVGRKLNQALELRNLARYDGNALITREMAQEVIGLAEDLLGKLEERLKEK